jgi:hypothetical protein
VVIIIEERPTLSFGEVLEELTERLRWLRLTCGDELAEKESNDGPTSK